jgi:ferredoxin-NADP reductase/MOSC domain-containing protein YiiM/predicted pyridoxine 5'-phosphate oxidase superfamily flavin-nucleotide-binding protein
MSEAKSPFHRGEKEIQSRLGIEEKMGELGRRMIHDQMPEQNQAFFSRLPLLIVGTIDATCRPWASALTGEPGFVRAAGSDALNVTARPTYGDPLGESLADGTDIGALGIDFESRRRNRVNGKVNHKGPDGFQIQVVQSFGNCPKYIQARQPTLGVEIENTGEKRPVHRGGALTKDQAAIVARADTLFIASQFSEDAADWSHGVDVSHRGGKPGFALVAHETLLLLPDYSGNCMFNTLGNIAINPKCGLLFIDFDTGDTLQLTGEAETLWEPAHTRRFPGAKRVLAFTVEESLQIERALPFTWDFQDYSPVFDKLEAAGTGEDAVEQLPPMKLKSVNVSMPKDIVHNGKAVTTGIFKEPVQGRVMLRRLNLDGDGQADLWGHGGAFRVVYVYSFENYAYWARELGRDDFTVGQFGENFTVEGMLEDHIHVGDNFRLGSALVEVSQPRVPCYKLAIKMGIEGFQNRFMASGRMGFYFRVLEEGEVGAGDTLELVRRDAGAMTVRAVNDLLYFDKENLTGTAKALAIPALAHGWKGSFEDRLVKAAAPARTRGGYRTFVVDRKEPESEAITSFYLVPEDGAALPPFLPGQFLTFELSIPGQPKPVLRTYSLSDRPNSDTYRVSIKWEPAPADRPDLTPGLSSSYFHDQIEVGAKLRIGAPRGKFHLEPEGERPVVLLSGGVGLTPMVSMMNTIVQSGTQRPVWFIHGARNGREHAMGAHVRRVAEANENVHAHIRYSQPEAEDIEGRDYDSQGRIDIALLKRLLPFDDHEFYLCGATPFMRSLYCGLLSLDVSEGRIHYEFFGPASTLKPSAQPIGPAKVPSAEAELTAGIQVTFARSGVTADWDPACESILDLAEQHGLNPDYSCRSGICQTCMCALVEGDVEYLEDPLDEPDPGCVLICCSRPKTSLVIEL